MSVLCSLSDLAGAIESSPHFNALCRHLIDSLHGAAKKVSGQLLPVLLGSWYPHW